MRAYVQPKRSRQIPLVGVGPPEPVRSGRARAADKEPQAPSYPAFDFSRIPVHLSARAEAATTAAGLHRFAAGVPPAVAPAIVHEVLRDPGRPIPAAVRRNMELRLGHDFADVRLHADERAAASAAAVAAHAYTVGRDIVFAAGRFDPASAAGERLLAHELAHAAGYAPGTPTPLGDLRISTPEDIAERHAVAVSEGRHVAAAAPAAQPRLFRQAGGVVALAGVRVNHDRVTVPPPALLSFVATKIPPGAPGVTLSIAGDNVKIAAGTTVSNTTGAITVAADQEGGEAHAEAAQNATGPGGVTITTTTPATAPFNFTAIPDGIGSTAASARNAAGFYGGDFIHTFKAPGGSAQTALERSHVNEQFAGATGSMLTLRGPLATLTISINNPNSPSAGWDLDSTGTMVAPDHVTWSNTVDARPFVTNASHPAPNPALPQELTATQNFRNLIFPNRTYASAAVASTTHRRAIEDRSDRLKAVTSANATGINQEIVEDYAGPTVFRRCRASPDTITVAAPAPAGGTAPAAATSTITVDAEGKAATPRFSIRPPSLGCRITAGGELTPGTTAGTVTVRAGDAANFDETTVTLTPPPAAATPNPSPAPQP